MNSCILKDILSNSERFSSAAKNHLLKDLRIPDGYLVNHMPHKPIPIRYNNYSECADDKCINICLKLVELHDNSYKTKNNKPKKIRKTKKNKKK